MYQERQDEQRERKEIVIPVAFPVAGQEQAYLVSVVWSVRAIASQHLALALILDLLVQQEQKQEAALELEHIRDKLRAFQGQAHSLPLALFTVPWPEGDRIRRDCGGRSPSPPHGAAQLTLNKEALFWLCETPEGERWLEHLLQEAKRLLEQWKYQKDATLAAVFAVGAACAIRGSVDAPKFRGYISRSPGLMNGSGEKREPRVRHHRAAHRCIAVAGHGRRYGPKTVGSLATCSSNGRS